MKILIKEIKASGKSKGIPNPNMNATNTIFKMLEYLKCMRF